MQIAVCDDCLEDALYLKALLGGQSVKTYSDTDSLLADIEFKNVRYDLYLLDIFMDAKKDVEGAENAVNTEPARLRMGMGSGAGEGEGLPSAPADTEPLLRMGMGSRAEAGTKTGTETGTGDSAGEGTTDKISVCGASICGLDLAKRLRALDADAVICFVSTSDAFYREAYDLYAVQYLLKPVREEDIATLLDRVARNLAKDKEQSLCFKRGGQTGSIPYSKILFISSREHTISIYCKDGTVQECKGKLNEIELQVSGDVFLRCHQSFLVNMYQIDNLSGYELMVSGHRVPISRRYYMEVKRRYQEVLFEEVD